MESYAVCCTASFQAQPVVTRHFAVLMANELKLLQEDRIRHLQQRIQVPYNGSNPTHQVTMLLLQAIVMTNACWTACSKLHRADM